MRGPVYSGVGSVRVVCVVGNVLLTICAVCCARVVCCVLCVVCCVLCVADSVLRCMPCVCVVRAVNLCAVVLHLPTSTNTTTPETRKTTGTSPDPH